MAAIRRAVGGLFTFAWSCVWSTGRIVRYPPRRGRGRRRNAPSSPSCPYSTRLSMMSPTPGPVPSRVAGTPSSASARSTNRLASPGRSP